MLLVGELFRTTISLQIHKQHLMTRMEMNNSNLSEVIRRSIYHGMLENDKESMRRTIETIGEGQGVTTVRIYNKMGTIIVSTHAEEIGTQVDMAAEACDGCHISGKPLQLQSDARYARAYRQSDGTRQLGIISPIKNDLTCSTAACHAHSDSSTVLGVLDVQTSLAQVDASLAAETKQLLTISTVTIIMMIALVGLFLLQTIHNPISRLMRGTQEAAAGNLKHRTDIKREDELGRLSRSFNAMLESLENAQSELQQWGDTLEDQVQAKSHELEQIHRQIIHVEKMTSLGRLSTTAAHELNNPLAGILNYTKLLLRELSRTELSADVRLVVERDLKFIRDESKRCGEIVKNLLFFAGRAGGKFQATAIIEVVERSLMLVTHKMEIQNIDLELKIDDEADNISCDPALLQQSFLAVLINSIEAMPNGGTLTFEYKSLPKSTHVEFHIADTGAGIADEQLDQIFEPFYTTKTEGKSVGMGLSVVYGIIHSHDGTITIRNREKLGTECVIRLPRSHTHAFTPDQSTSVESA